MFRQEFEISTDCKKTETLFKRFSKKFPKAWEVWGDLFRWMLETGKEHYEDIGWSLWLYVDDETHYKAIVLTDKAQEL